MHIRRIVGRIAVFLALIGGAISVSDPSLAYATQIRCGGHDCSTLWVRCRGVDDCSVGIFGEGFEGPFNVAVTHILEGVTTTELRVVARFGDLVIRTGPGNDTVVFDDTHIPGTLRIMTGSGDDHVTLSDTGAAGTTGIATGSGADVVFSDGIGLRGGSWLRAGGGDDSVVLRASVLDGTITVDGGRGTDTLGAGTDGLNTTIVGFEKFAP